jgi:hypothetical protein
METKEAYKAELQDSGNSNSQEKKQDRGTKMLEFKLRALGNPDSIFILPYGAEGFKMAHMSRMANKFISAVKRKFGIALDMSKARQIFDKFDSLSGSLWEFVYEISPNLHHIEARDWRKVNDSVEMKKSIAHRRASVVIEPKAEEAAKIAMAVKIIQQRNVEIRPRASFDELEIFVKKYVDMISEIDSVLQDVAEELDQEYRPYLKESNL